MLLSCEFGIVYKGYLTEKYTDEVVAIKTLKGELMIHKSLHALKHIMELLMFLNTGKMQVSLMLVLYKSFLVSVPE